MYKFNAGTKKGGSDGLKDLFMTNVEYTWISDDDVMPTEKKFLGKANTVANQYWVDMNEMLLNPLMKVTDDSLGEANLFGSEHDEVRMSVINLFYTKLADTSEYSAQIRFESSGGGATIPIVLVLVAVMIIVAVVCWVKRDKLPCCKGGKKNLKAETEMKE